jgi:AraC-like DNA-binding protein
MYVSNALIRAVVTELEREGVDGDELFEAAALDPKSLADPGGDLSIEDYVRLVSTAIERAPDPAFGLKAGWHAPTGAAHVVGFALVNSRTLRDAIQTFLRYSSLIMEGAAWSLTESSGMARFGYTNALVEGEVARFEAELVMSFLLARFGVPFIGTRAELEAACFCHPAPPWVEVYERVFPCELHFEAEQNELVFARAYLDVPQLCSDEWIFELLRERADTLLRARHSDERLAERVKDLVKYQLGLGQLDASLVAQELGVSPRTLRRRLSGLGCSLRDLYDETRKELACAALTRSDRSIKEVCYGLGFSEPSAFYRAFKRWTGLTPQQFRASSAEPRFPPSMALAGVLSD